MTNTDLDWLDSFVNKYEVKHPQIVGGWINDVYIFRKDEFKQAITSHIEEAVREAYKKGYTDAGIAQLIAHENDKGRQD